MHMHARRMTLTALAILLASAIFGCGTGAGKQDQVTQAGTDEKLTIHLMHLWPEAGALGQHQIVNKIVREYQAAHPNVSIKQEVFDNEQYKTKIKVLAAVNELPDVGLTWAAGYIRPFVEGRLFAPLDELLQDGLKDMFLAGATEAYAVGGRTYALPLEFNLAPVYYNKRIFEEYGLQVPETYDDLLHVVKTLRDFGIEPVTLGNRDRWTGSLWYMYMADRIAGTNTLTSAIKGAASFADPGLLDAAKRIQALVDLGAFNDGFNGLSNDEAKVRFMNSETAMYLVGTWELPNYTTNRDVPQQFRDSIGFFKFPAVEGGRSDLDSWVGGPGVGLFVAEDSQVKAEAKKFVKYFVERWGEESVAGAGVIPATKVDTSKSRLPQIYIDLLNEVNKATSITLFADVQMTSSAAEVHLNQIQALFGKEIAPEQFAAAHDAAVR